MPAPCPRFRRPYALFPLLVGLTLTGLLGPAHAAPGDLHTAPGGLTAGTIPNPPTTPLQKSMLLQVQDAFINIAQAVEPTVVNIKAQRLHGADTVDGSGSDSPPPPSRRHSCSCRRL